MRNLKRVLSLSLASIMLLGIMVIGSSAAQDYTDVDYSADNIEAIEVLDAINVMRGDLDDNGELAGTFRPGSDVKRSEMARIMAFLMDLDYDYYIGANPFADMVGHWAEKYAAACYANGIISGRTTTAPLIYDPDATVTAVEAASMLMRALGYFQNKDVDYPDGFEISTIRQAGKIDLFKYVDAKTNEPMTRNDVAQLVLNALQSGMVEPGTGRVEVAVGDAQVTFGSSNYVYTVARDPVVGNAINTTKAEGGNSSTGLEGDILDLGEKLYDGKLKLKKNEIDVFGRPARKWEFDGKAIGTYEKKELLEESYTNKVTGETLYELLGKTAVEKYNFVITIDGVDTDSTGAKVLLDQNGKTVWFDKTDLYRTNKDAVGGTGKGVLTNVYVDTGYANSSDYTVYISIINTYLAIAAEDYNEKDKDVDLKVYGITKPTGSGEYVKHGKDDRTIAVPVDDIDVSEVEKDEMYLVHVADGRIQEMIIPEVLSKVVIDSFSLNSWVNTDGNKYDYAATARYDTKVLDKWTSTTTTNLKDLTYNIILDEYGYLIGVERNEDPDQYVFLTGIESGYSNLGSRNVEATVIHLDGTIETVTVDTRKSTLSDFTEPSQANTWCTYSVSTAGVYTLREVAGALDVANGVDVAQHAQDVSATGSGSPKKVEIDQKHVTLYGNSSGSLRVYGNDKSVYINVELEQIQVDNPSGNYRRIIDDVTSVTTGIKNTKISVENVANTNVKGSTTIGSGDNTYVAPVNEIYTLYDDESYIIATVTIGEDEGVASNWVLFINNKLKQEAYNGDSDTRAAGDGKWTWSREVLNANGEIVDIHEVGDTIQWLETPTKNSWREVKYDANGNVRKIEDLTNSLSSKAAGFTNNIADVQRAINNGKDTVLLQDTTNIRGLTFNEQGTLYVQNDTTKGFSVHPDVVTVLALADKNRTTYDSVDNSYKGYSGLKDAMRDMNASLSGAKAGDIELSAILVNGAATVIVINDTVAPTSQKPNQNVSGNNGDVTYASGLTEDDWGKISDDSVTVQPNGKVNAAFTLTKPDWVYLDKANDIGGGAGDVKVYFDVFMDGATKEYGSGTATIATTDDETIVFESDLVNASHTGDTIFANINETKNHTLTMKITGVDWPAAKVVVQDNNGNTLATKGDTNKYLELTGTNTLKFQLNTSDTTTTGVKYDVTGLKQNISDKTMTGTIDSEETVSTTAAAKGKEPVVITVKSAVKQIFKVYSGDNTTTGGTWGGALSDLKSLGLDVIGLADDSGAWDDTRVGITAANGTTYTVDEGKTFTYTISMSGFGEETAIEKYVIYYTVENGSETEDGSVELTWPDVEDTDTSGGNISKTVTVARAEGNLRLTITQVEAVLRFRVTGAKIASDGKSVTITFSEAPKNLSDSATIDGTGTKVNNYINVLYNGSDAWEELTEDDFTFNGNTMTITMNAAEGSAKTLTGSTKIIIDAPVINAAGKQVKACTLTWTTIAGDPTLS